MGLVWRAGCRDFAERCGKLLDVTQFGALIRAKRGTESQQALASRIWRDPSRKADISRLENGKVPNPQEKTVKLLCDALGITEAEMAPIRQARPTAAQLDRIEALSHRDLILLAALFGIDGAADLPIPELKRLLELKGDEYRALRLELESLTAQGGTLDNVAFAALAALEERNLEEAERLLADAREIVRDQLLEPLQRNAKLMELEAQSALLRGNTDQAYRLLSAAADSFAAVSQTERIDRRLYKYPGMLRGHALQYGGEGFIYCLKMVAPFEEELEPQKDAKHAWSLKVWQGLAFRNLGKRTEGAKGADLLADAVAAYRAALEVYTRAEYPVLWATTQNNLGTALQDQGTRSDGAKGADLLADAVNAFHAALEVYTRAEHPVDWAGTQNNLGNALADQGTRTDGAQGADLLADAVTALRAALQVTTLAAHPVEWAETRANIAFAEVARADHDTCADPAPHLRAALQAVEGALEVFDPDHMSYQNGVATRVRNDIQARLAALAGEA